MSASASSLGSDDITVRDLISSLTALHGLSMVMESGILSSCVCGTCRLGNRERRFPKISRVGAQRIR